MKRLGWMLGIVSLGVSGCSGGGGGASLPAAGGTSGRPAAQFARMMVDSYAASVTEYDLPSGQRGGGIVVGPDGAVWFTARTAVDRILSTGVITSYTRAGNDYTSYGNPDEAYDGAATIEDAGSIVVSPNKTMSVSALWQDPNDPGLSEYQAKVASISTAGVISAPVFTTLPHSYISSNLYFSSDGLMRFGQCGGYCAGDSLDRFTTLNVNTSPASSTEIPSRTTSWVVENTNNHHLYVADSMCVYPNGEPKVQELALDGTILHTYAIPGAGCITGLAFGPDYNLWIAQTAAFSNQDAIVRLSFGRYGKATTFPLNHSAAPLQIVRGPDGAMWFSEYFANRIGRITMAGQITEYPTSQNTVGIVGCRGDAVHGRIWFTESTKVGKLEY